MIPLKLVLIIHETPGTIYSLIPGDSISPGSVIEKLEIGEIGEDMCSFAEKSKKKIEIFDNVKAARSLRVDKKTRSPN